jgi:hypothetical protein
MADGTALGEPLFRFFRLLAIRNLPPLTRSYEKVTAVLLLQRSVPHQRVSISSSYEKHFATI